MALSNVVFDILATDDRKNYYISTRVDGSLGPQLEALTQKLIRKEIMPHGGKRVTSPPSRGHHITLFYGCTPALGAAAITATRSIPLDWKDCELETDPEPLGPINAKRDNSQAWVVKVKSWPNLHKAHEVVKVCCIQDEAERAQARKFLPHITLAYVQDAPQANAEGRPH